jgi:hypothetical protein
MRVVYTLVVINMSYRNKSPCRWKERKIKFFNLLFYTGYVFDILLITIRTYYFCFASLINLELKLLSVPLPLYNLILGTFITDFICIYEK